MPTLVRLRDGVTSAIVWAMLKPRILVCRHGVFLVFADKMLEWQKPAPTGTKGRPGWHKQRWISFRQAKDFRWSKNKSSGGHGSFTYDNEMC